ncbi:hypothetical protein [Ureibacillus xyleni]|uniref:hypothetical protein n=1 Tax=Ureibacillus xyleni TaxID=614648 RepID=UPI000BE394E1|nr:hypothetical protein [Ureibacillus xyleni]
MDLASALNYMTLPLDDGNLFTIESNEELRIIESIELPIDIRMTEKKLSEAYGVIVGYLDINE